MLVEVPPERFELPTGRLEICCSIQLSYGGGRSPSASRRCRLRTGASEVSAATERFASRACGLPRDLVLYLARHECGTKICREKGIEYARRLLGHANISTTQVYTRLDFQHLARAYDAAHPRALRPKRDPGTGR